MRELSPYLKRLHTENPRFSSAQIRIISESLSQLEMAELYRRADAFVLPSRGEGWGRPYMEAMASGLPTIGTRWGGNLDFMSEENSFLIECEVKRVSERAAYEWPLFRGHNWAEPSEEHLRYLMRTVYENPTGARNRAASGAVEIADRFDVSAATCRVVPALAEVEVFPM
jgi:glycosyltransferase involved in cell wall biosynthesis